jgi:RimJ/RimL family protein N-acetyltransferase
VHDYQTRPEAKHGIVLAGERVDLVALAERHLPLVIAWRNDPAIRRRFFNRRIFTAASELDWFGRYEVDPTTFSFAIALKGGRTIGMVGLKVDWGARTGEFGRFIIGDPLSIGRGYGREAARLVLDFARFQLGLRSLWLGVFPDNAAAVHLYRSLGFVDTVTIPRETSDGVMGLSLRMTLSFDAEPPAGSPNSDSVPS